MPESVVAAEKSLVETVWDLLDADSELDEDAKYLVIAAMESSEALADQVGGVESTRLRPDPQRSPERPAGAFLHEIEVSGFRGIGRAATLKITPFPGITVVSGRNGSGKSSFAEALEFALTGQSYRWSKKAKLWQDNWRNLHSPEPCSVRVQFTVEGDRATSIGADWARDADLTDAKHWSARAGEKRQAGVSALGWTNAVEVFRPLLSYDEIGGLLEQEPSKLYDALAKLLGLEEIQDAETRLDALHKEKRIPRQNAKDALTGLKAQLAEADDDRAATLAKLLRSRKPDLDAIADLATGGAGAAESTVARLNSLATLTTPDPVHAAGLAAQLRDALANARSLADDATRASDQRSELLRTALRLRDDHLAGDSAGQSITCPVCGEGTLDEQWAAHTREVIDAESQQLAMYREARTLTQRLESEARTLLTSPATLAPIDGIDLATLAAYQQAVTRAVEVPSAVEDLAAHLEARIPELDTAAAALRAEAAEHAAALHDSWTPIAEATASWLTTERDARSSDEIVGNLDVARKWVKANAEALRAERLRPIADGARAIWARLRQESNVEIADIALKGARTRRQAVLTGTVDGQPAGALSVMSQGELHALALALFLPRATAAASPFRFVVLDDPIQAMDPAKIDGFLDVLTDLAATRQVVVFSHDDRLAAAIRQRSVPAQLLEVRREQSSQVVVKFADVPARRYVQDVRALVSDTKLPDAAKLRVAPGLFRIAIEAAAKQVYFTQRNIAGEPQEETEHRWGEAKSASACVALALAGDREANISGWRSHRQYRCPAMYYATKGVHQGVTTVTHADVDNLEKTVNDLLELL